MCVCEREYVSLVASRSPAGTKLKAACKAACPYPGDGRQAGAAVRDLWTVVVLVPGYPGGSRQ